MLLSVDSRSFLLSKIRSRKILNDNLPNSLRKFLGEGSGPQEFITELLLEINKSNKIKTTYNFLKSDLHLLNLGFYSKFWNHVGLKDKKKVIVRFDGVGIDTSNNVNETKNKLNNIVSKGKFIIFQSEFCKLFFKNEFGYMPDNVVINNGALETINSSSKKKYFPNYKLNIPTNEDYFVAAGRYTGRKRIKETIKSFSKFGEFFLAVLSNVPENEKIKHPKIKYLGIQNPRIAKEIINSSKALIHMDSYDWCPNIVISALANNVPVICSNFGGTPEIVKENGIIVKEFPDNLEANMEGIKLSRNSIFPDNLLYEALSRLKDGKTIINFKNNYSIKSCADKYIETFQKHF